jgi:predicted nucleic acid-binding protein
MEQPQYLIDTNAVIDYLSGKLPDSGVKLMNDVLDNTSPNISLITKIELLSFNASHEHSQLLKNFIGDVRLLELENNVVDQTIDIRKNHKTKLPDAIIAATALVHDLILISRNTSDFKNIEGLTTINPHGS